MPFDLNPSPVRSDVLRSWKEIAAYLHCAVRTAQRWEAQLGLPVHRLRAQHRDAVISDRKELDEWLIRTFSKKETTPATDVLPGAAILDQACLDLARDLEVLRTRLAISPDGGNLAEKARLIEAARAKVFTSIQLMDESGSDNIASHGAATELDARSPYGVPMDVNASRVRFLLSLLQSGLNLAKTAKLLDSPRNKEVAERATTTSWRAYSVVLRFLERARLDETMRARLHDGLADLRVSLDSLPTDANIQNNKRDRPLRRSSLEAAKEEYTPAGN